MDIVKKDGNKLGRKQLTALAQKAGALPRPFKNEDPASRDLIVTQTTTEFRGPIPHPDIIAGYDKVQPGLGARIIEMSMQQSAHRQVLEKAVLDAQIKDVPAARLERRIGQIIGGIIVLAALVTAVLIAKYGSGPFASPSASVLGSLPLCGLVAVFITGKVKEGKKPD